MKLVKQIRDIASLRESFFALAEDVFDISFRTWYQNGYWTDRYIPYAMADGDRVAANASVNLIDTIWQGVQKQFVQIGTVMTHPDFRGRGLSRALITEILDDWGEKADVVYLYANETVLGFYPKFGFVPAHECQNSGEVTVQDGDFVPLDMTNAVHRECLLRCYRLGNPFSAMPCLHNEGLLLFYCTGFMRDCIWYSKRLDTAAIAEWEGDVLYCHDLFGIPQVAMDTVLAHLARPATKTAVLGFAPKEAWGSIQEIDGEDFLFVWSGGENPFAQVRVRMPLLSHA